MTKFARYNDAGEIIAVGDVPKAMLKCQPGMLYIGEVDQQRQYILDGQLCDYTEAELAIKNNLPPGHIWKMPERIAFDRYRCIQSSV